MVHMQVEGSLTVDGDGRVSPHYVSILKGRLGELRALAATTQHRWQRFTPLVEAVAADNEAEDDALGAVKAIDESLTLFARRLAERWPAERALIVDAGLISSPDAIYVPMARLIEEFRLAGRPVRPTVRPSDSPEVIRSVGRGA